MTPLDQVLATIALLNDARGTGGQTALAKRLKSHVAGKHVNPRTVRAWVAGVTTPSPGHLEQMRGIREIAERPAMMHTGRELLRLLRENGFELVSVRGSHYKLRHAEGREVILPYCQRQYPKATYFNILKQAGIRQSDEAKRRREGAGKAESPGLSLLVENSRDSAEYSG